MSRTSHRVAASVLGLGLGVSALAPGLAGAGYQDILDFGDTDRIVSEDLPVILDDVEGGVVGLPGLLGGGGGGLLGALLWGAEELADAPVVGGGDVGEDSHVGRGVLGGDDGIAAPGGLGGLLRVGSLNEILGGLL